MPEKAKTGDEVTNEEGTRQGKVVKVKPDGTRVVKDKTGKLPSEDNPPKVRDEDTDDED